VIRSDRSTTCAPDGILAKDRIAAACRCWQPVAPGVTGYETELSIPPVETTCACAFDCTGSTSITKRVATSSSICSPLMTGTTSTPPWPRTCRWGSRRCGPFACGRGGAGEDLRRAQGGPPGSRRSCWAPSSSCTPRTGSSRDCLFGVVDVAGPILEAKDVPGLGHVRDPAGSSSGPSDDEG
jgi:hypothetical protein